MNEIQKYFRFRQALIEQYLKGDMTKSEYLSRNLEAVLSLNIKPFKNMDTVDKGLFNYQYYNAMAKEANAEAHSYGDRELQKESYESANHFYYKKDRATMAVLKLLDYRGVSAYFIHVRSKELKGKLFEIVIEDHDSILHSTNQRILADLQAEQVFLDETKTSLIDYYVNQKYM